MSRYQIDFFAHRAPFLFRPRVFSRALDCGAPRGPACARRCECGSRSGSVARVLGANSGEQPWDRFPPGQSLARQCKTHVSAFFSTTTMRVWRVLARTRAVGVLPVGVCMCAGLCICVVEPHVSAFGIFLLCLLLIHSFIHSFICLLLLMMCASCLYHTVPQPLKLSTLWEPRYNSGSRTPSSSFCDGHGRCISLYDVWMPCFLWERTQPLGEDLAQGCC